MSAAPRLQLVPSSANALLGVQKAAILVMYLERDAARELLRHLTDDDVKQVGVAIAGLREVPEEVIEGVVHEFLEQLRHVTVLPATGPDFVRNVLPSLVDEERRERVTHHARRQADDFEAFIRTRPSPAIAAVLADEHPQVRAVALLRMGAENAARVLACYDQDAQSDLTIRMSRAERVAGELAEDVEVALRRALEDIEDPLPLGGVESAARILGRMPRERNSVVLDNVRSREEDLAEDLSRSMISFEDLEGLDARAIQQVLRVVERSDLVMALKGAAESLREKFLSNLSTRAAADIREEIEILGPVRRSMLKEAQEKIVAAARKLAEEGVIVLEVGGEEE
ncbi:MAG: hypothetical protein RLZZ299_120 [Pseudomonadota bacterium]